MAEQHATTTELRRQLADILVSIDAGHHVHITHYDRPAGVLVPHDWHVRATYLIQCHGLGGPGIAGPAINRQPTTVETDNQRKFNHAGLFSDTNPTGA